MFKPRVLETDKVHPDELKEKLSTLKAEISSLEDSEIFENTFSFNDVVEILEKENASLSKLLDYEETIRKPKLEQERSILLRDKDEEENVIACCSDYFKNESFVRGEAIDNGEEMLLKLEVLHKKLCTLLKKFAHENFPVQDEESNVKSNTSRKVSSSSIQKKSVLDILKLLLPELNPTNSDNLNLETRVLKIDETIPSETIEFLLSADIIEWYENNPNCIKLFDY